MTQLLLLVTALSIVVGILVFWKQSARKADPAKGPRSPSTPARENAKPFIANRLPLENPVPTVRVPKPPTAPVFVDRQEPVTVEAQRSGGAESRTQKPHDDDFGTDVLDWELKEPPGAGESATAVADSTGAKADLIVEPALAAEPLMPSRRARVELADLAVVGRPYRRHPGVLRLDLTTDNLRADILADPSQASHVLHIVHAADRLADIGSFPLAPVFDGDRCIGALCPDTPDRFETYFVGGENAAVVALQLWSHFMLDPEVARARASDMVEAVARLHDAGLTTEGSIAPWLVGARPDDGIWIDDVVGTVRPLPSGLAEREKRRRADARLLSYVLLPIVESAGDTAQLSLLRDELETMSASRSIGRARLFFAGMDLADLLAYAEFNEPASVSALRAGYPNEAIELGLLDENIPASVAEVALALHYAAKPPELLVDLAGSRLVIAFRWPPERQTLTAEISSRALGLKLVATRQPGKEWWQHETSVSTELDRAELDVEWRPLFERDRGR